MPIFNRLENQQFHYVFYLKKYMTKLYLLDSKHIFDILTHQNISLDEAILNSSEVDYLVLGFCFSSFPLGYS